MDVWKLQLISFALSPHCIDASYEQALSKFYSFSTALLSDINPDTFPTIWELICQFQMIWDWWW